MEQWLPVIGYEGYYEVSDCGQVRRLPGRIYIPSRPCWRAISGGVLEGKVAKNGYRRVTLSVGGNYKTHWVAWLVLAAFVGPKPNGFQVAHNNGMRTDNRLENLRYATRKENEADKLLHGTHNRGDRCPTRVLDSRQVLEVLEMRQRGMTQKAIADLFGVTDSTIRKIECGRNWSSVTGRCAA